MNELLSYIYDFLSVVLEEKEIKEQIKKIVLYGSVAKGMNDKESDIDLFFEIKNKEKTEKTEKALREKVKTFEIKAEKTWKLKKVRYPLSFIVGQLEDENWKSLKDEIISSGIVLYGAYEELPKKLSHYHLYYYSLASLKRKDKMKFIRKIQGYAIKKNKKEYKQEGFLQETNGKKLASNVLLVPVEESIKLKKIFKEYKIRYNVSEVWIRA